MRFDIRRIVLGFAEALGAAVLPAVCALCAHALPLRQEGGVCPACWDAIPWSPRRVQRSGVPSEMLWAAVYDGAVRRLVHGLKFEDRDELATPLGRRMARLLAHAIHARRVDLVVPVPLHLLRRYRRGYNQAALLAAALAARAGLPFDARALRRRRAGRQLGLTRRERLRALDGCFAARPPRVRGRTVLLVDDVSTTGATLEACARALAAAGARRVIGCVLARTPKHRP